jgi:putative Ca2+/H+ antiporter (TMEM165/GDT1 family)
MSSSSSPFSCWRRSYRPSACSRAGDSGGKSRPSVQLSIILSTFGLIFLAELPDKTAMASLTLATRYRMRDVIAGAWLAFLLLTGIAVAGGSLLQLLPARPVQFAAGVAFLVFAVLALRRQVDEEAPPGAAESAPATSGRRPAWLASFLIVFAAEFGDLTQLTTAALVAQTGRPLEVAIGAVAALWTVNLLAVTAGAQLARFLRPRVLQILSALLFTVVGVIVIVQAVAG